MTVEDKGNDSEQSATTATNFVPFNEKYLELTDPTARHWLPTDIYVNQDGSVDFKSYINNIHPEDHADMYTSISKIISKAIPLLEQALTDWEHPRDLRIPYDFDTCLEFPTEHPAKLEGKFNVHSSEYYQAVDEWKDTIIDTTPDPEEFVEPERPMVPYSLRNKNLQVVVEIADRGMEYLSDTASENIIATVEYYYDSKGEKPLTIEFQEAIKTEPDSIGDGYDLLAYNKLYGISTPSEGEEYIQSAGSIDAKQGRLVCYPNVYEQNRHYGDGAAKWLKVYFIDPAVRIVSTAIVPPQQKDWWTKTVSSVPSRVSMLPLEVQEMVFKHVDSPMSFERACEVSKKAYKASYDIMESLVFECYVYVGDRSYSDQYDILPALSARGY
ncbi:hypothetical protein LPJ57_004695 [Coemansia sp. RSA 486]|nr:hypothetical protein LPJ57_004695 [Coemansia sp. RSA 486]